MNPSFNIDPSVTSVLPFADLANKPNVCKIPQGFKACVIGGGTGAPASIKTLRSLGIETSAVVAMADDGGSTGDLRKDANVTPPGDIRKCLCAFATEPDDPFARAFKYRFPVANNHTLGNLMLSALEDSAGSFPEAIQICEKLLHCDGHVYPSTLEHVFLVSETVDGSKILGQAEATHSHAALRRVKLINENKQTPKAFEPACEAIRGADLIVLGPGSLFTSIIPNLLVDGITDAIMNSRGKVVFVCGISDVQGETWGMAPFDHVRALLDHGMESLVDYVLLHSCKADSFNKQQNGQSANMPAASAEVNNSESLSDVSDAQAQGFIHQLDVSPENVSAIQSCGPVAVIENLMDPNNPSWHDLGALRGAFERIITMMISRRGY
ncbi:MAG: YvcK family protein [Phoenicibacter congonensis]|uniref:Putative gluconeogenesis factor n=1 Tax=Phoenicibacter congonensis TaxID=1944646 RepID=A0AA43RHT3_9ACTN|nr:YvcK family protein [Phoenicibacter congonensis]